METSVPGLYLFPDHINIDFEEKLLNEIDNQIWIVDYNRRLQYSGYRNELETPYDLVKFPCHFRHLFMNYRNNWLRREY